MKRIPQECLLHATFKGQHDHWKDQVLFYKDGLFKRASSSCTGKWVLKETGELSLKWDHWAEEKLVANDAGGFESKRLKLLPMEGQLEVFDIARHPLKRIHIGCGPNFHPGWLNIDQPEVDIRKQLPWEDGSIEALFLEHVIEHISPPSAYRFMREAIRVLKKGGVLRLAFPDVLRIAQETTPEYLAWLKKCGWGDGSAGSAVASIVLNHGHLGVWSEATMRTVLESVGFTVESVLPGQSSHEHLVGLEKHGTRIGEAFNAIETCCLEATK
jgi:SAM-dependent methyltransferase